MAVDFCFTFSQSLIIFFHFKEKKGKTVHYMEVNLLSD